MPIFEHKFLMMAIFQRSVLDKKIKLLDKEVIKNAYTKFCIYFHNTSRQDNIRDTKEEQFQEGFLRELFVNILGYTLNPEPNYNLTSEFKNAKDSKKADGAIIINGEVKGVIELKGTKTIDLGTVESQAFGYKNNQKNCEYVIISNFEKLRFYIDNAVDYLEFNLFSLSQTDFEIMYFCMCFEHISKGITKATKNESESHEDTITKKLYNDYSLFKRELFQNLVLLNPQYHPLDLFKKSQKLLDRFLFLFFAEDRHLLPPNSVRLILEQWKKLTELDEYRPLYERFKKYFGYLNTGYKGKQYDVFAYNGGLFMFDEILDTIKIDDEILAKHTLKISEYDFASEVDVNILGHIFENSLNELDEIKAQLEGKEIDKSSTKRKKDGVFYTPKYITKYIVENTVGKLCTEQKILLQIVEDEYFIDKKRSKNVTKVLQDKLVNYRNWLLKITICDPACGSGAFLNQALDFLIAEHRYIDELQAKLFGDALVLSDVEKSILENNLFGVDLNEESVEIAKLSLWLRTAQPHRKLNDLNNNIKCGNSLISDPAIAGEKAFDWFAEFTQVFPLYKHPKTTLEETESIKFKTNFENDSYGIFNEFHEPPALYSYSKNSKGFENHGFDVIIGNPPYGVNFSDLEKKYLSKFDSLVPDFEIYIYFISLYKKILKNDSLLSYIFPNTFLSTIFGKKYREFIFKNIEVYQIVDLSNDNTFVDAAVRTCVFSIKNKFSENYYCELVKMHNNEFKSQSTLSKQIICLDVENILSLFSQNSFEKIIINKVQLNKALKNFHIVSQGLIPYDKYRGHDEFTIKNRIWHSDFQKDETYKKELKGGDVNRYTIGWNGNLWISYGNWLAAPREPKFFTSKRVLVREITSDTLSCGYTEIEYYNTPSVINIINENDTLDLKYTLVVLNSKLVGWLHNKVSPKANKGLFPKILINDIRNIPLVEIDKTAQQPFIDKADLMISLNQELQEHSLKFQKTIKREFSINDLSKKLHNWDILSYAEFLKELEKLKIKLTLTQKADFEDYFETEKSKANILKYQISQTDQQINAMVYQLYQLTDEEIKIIEMV